MFTTTENQDGERHWCHWTAAQDRGQVSGGGDPSTLEGDCKWDGCWNWRVSGDRYWHFCSMEDLLELTWVMGYIRWYAQVKFIGRPEEWQGPDERWIDAFTKAIHPYQEDMDRDHTTLPDAEKDRPKRKEADEWRDREPIG